MDKYFYVDTDGRQCGPVEEDKLISNGVTSSTKIWKRGMKGYVHAGKLLPHIFVAEPVKPRTDYIPSPRDKQNNAVKYYYIDEANHQIGPVKEEELIARGVTATTKIWRKGLPKYIDAGIILPTLFQSDMTSSQPETPDGSKTGNATGSTSSQPETTGGSKTSVESSSDWKTYAIIQLIATFVIFLPLSFLFVGWSSTTMDNNVDMVNKHGGSAGAFVVYLIGKVAWYGAKYWPLIAIGIAGLISIGSMFDDGDYRRKHTLLSLSICIGMAVFGIVSVFYPMTMFILLFIGLSIALVIAYNWDSIKSELKR